MAAAEIREEELAPSPMPISGRDGGLLKPPHARERAGRHTTAAGALAGLHRLDIKRAIVADPLGVGLCHSGLAGHALLAIRCRILAPAGEIVLGVAAARSASRVRI